MVGTRCRTLASSASSSPALGGARPAGSGLRYDPKSVHGAIGIHHLGIAVSDLDAAAAQYGLLIGAEVDHGQDSEALGTRALALRTPQGPMIELVAPYAEDTPVGRFITKRGEGMHHVAYEVADLAAEVARLVAAGVDMIDEAPRAGLFGLQVAFIHPDAVSGVLLELVQPGGKHHG